LQYHQPQQQQQQQLQQLHSPFQPTEQLAVPETGDEDDVVLLEVQPASKKLKPAPQGQRAR